MASADDITIQVKVCPVADKFYPGCAECRLKQAEADLYKLRGRVGRLRAELRRLNKAHVVLWQVLRLRAPK